MPSSCINQSSYRPDPPPPSSPPQPLSHSPPPPHHLFQGSAHTVQHIPTRQQPIWTIILYNPSTNVNLFYTILVFPHSATLIALLMLKWQCHRIFEPYYFYQQALPRPHMNKLKRFCNIFCFCKDICKVLYFTMIKFGILRIMKESICNFTQLFHISC